jgi:hypothetical protein
VSPADDAQQQQPHPLPQLLHQQQSPQLQKRRAQLKRGD